MIRSFKCKKTEKIFRRRFVKGFSFELQKVAYRKLEKIHRTMALEHLRVPRANHLEMLKGDLSGKHSIRINKQYRIVFNWHNGNAYNVEIIDYH